MQEFERRLVNLENVVSRLEEARLPGLERFYDRKFTTLEEKYRELASFFHGEFATVNNELATVSSRLTTIETTQRNQGELLKNQGEQLKNHGEQLKNHGDQLTEILI